MLVFFRWILFKFLASKQVTLSLNSKMRILGSRALNVTSAHYDLYYMVILLVKHTTKLS